MRARGHSFVILTIAFLFLMQIVATNWDSLTNGTGGITLPLPTWSIDIQYWPFYYSLMAILAASMLMSWWIRRNKFGMGLIAIREDEDKAATVGVNTRVYKILAFAASAVFVGMAGGVYGYYLAFIDPIGMFNILLSVQIILSLLLGGRATLWGPVLGAFIVEGLNEFSNNDLGGGNSRLLVFGGLLALMVLFMSRGIIPTVGDWIESVAQARQGRPRRRAAGRHRPRRARGALRAAAARRRPAAARGQGARAALRRSARGGRGELRRARGLDHGADRPERLGQDDRLQPDRRHDGPERRARSGSTAGASTA